MADLNRVTHVVIHTAATANGADISADTIRQDHIRSRGWSDIGYHWVVRKDGRVELGRPETEVGAHVEGFNAQSIGVCFAGNGDLEDLTDAQKAAGAKLVAEILRRHDLTDEFRRNPRRVIGHREINDLITCGVAKHAKHTGKSCPGNKVSPGQFRIAVRRVLG